MEHVLINVRFMLCLGSGNGNSTHKSIEIQYPPKDASVVFIVFYHCDYKYALRRTRSLCLLKKKTKTKKTASFRVFRIVPVQFTWLVLCIPGLSVKSIQAEQS